MVSHQGITILYTYYIMYIYCIYIHVHIYTHTHVYVYNHINMVSVIETGEKSRECGRGLY